MEYKIKVTPSSESFVCRDDEFIIAAMQREHSGPIHYGCFGGGCGICKMRIVSGSYESVKKMSRAHITAAEEEQGFVLICCVKPRSDLVIARVENKQEKERKG